MVEGKVEKIAAISIAVFVIALSMARVADWHSVGIYDHCPIWNRLAYPFFHAGLIHALLNAWCFLSLVFLHGVSWRRMLLAYAIAVSFPVDTITSLFPLPLPSVGLSGVIYALFGSISFEVRDKRSFQCWMLFYVAVGFFFPGVSATLHLYCYLCGIAIALLNRPMPPPRAGRKRKTAKWGKNTSETDPRRRREPTTHVAPNLRAT